MSDFNVHFIGAEPLAVETDLDGRWRLAAKNIPIREETKEGRPKFKTVGLSNPGNLCYRNVVVQALFHNARIRGWLWQWYGNHDCGGQGSYRCIRCNLSRALTFYWNRNAQKGEKHAVEQLNKSLAYLTNHCARGYSDAPGELVRFPEDGSTDKEEDVGELMDFVFNYLHHNTTERGSELLYGLLGIEVVRTYDPCKDCGEGWEESFPEMVWRVTVPSKDESTNVADLILDELEVDSEGGLKCSTEGCSKSKRRQPKWRCSHAIKAAGSLLIVSLNLWGRDEDGTVVKNTRHVEVNDTLDLSDWYPAVDPSKKYKEKPLEFRARGVICHDGDMDSGHYRFYARVDGPKEHWIEADDARVTKVPENVALSVEPNKDITPYVIFYERVQKEQNMAENLLSDVEELEEEKWIDPMQEDGKGKRAHKVSKTDEVALSHKEDQNRLKDLIVLDPDEISDHSEQGDIEAVVKWFISCVASHHLEGSSRLAAMKEILRAHADSEDSRRRNELMNYLHSIWSRVQSYSGAENNPLPDEDYDTDTDAVSSATFRLGEAIEHNRGVSHIQNQLVKYIKRRVGRRRKAGKKWKESKPVTEGRIRGEQRKPSQANSTDGSTPKDPNKAKVRPKKKRSPIIDLFNNPLNKEDKAKKSKAKGKRFTLVPTPPSKSKSKTAPAVPKAPKTPKSPKIPKAPGRSMTIPIRRKADLPPPGSPPAKKKKKKDENKSQPKGENFTYRPPKDGKK